MGRKALLKFYGEVMAFYLYFLVNIAWIDTLVHVPNVILTALLKLFCLLLIGLPVLTSMERREGLGAMFLGAMKAKFERGLVLQTEAEKVT